MVETKVPYKADDVNMVFVNLGIEKNIQGKNGKCLFLKSKALLSKIIATLTMTEMDSQNIITTNGDDHAMAQPYQGFW